MVTRMKELDVELLREAAGSFAYCGYSRAVKAAANRLESAGLGRVSENDLGPIFRTNAAGLAALREAA